MKRTKAEKSQGAKLSKPAFVERGGKDCKIEIRLTGGEKQRLEALATTQGRSVASIVREALNALVITM
jgi:hypothetical protein